ncbi:hypothetical protein AGRO_2944 [Agrobacterium sp. ATCC 31749]|uniref:hypothetical protein n=1 Tax=unclassified Agrobacterium TaxID=2632611 RepID=UPI00020DB3C9|nr:MULTISPECIES: hypothetical protein [unclassified Agrobacterium]EGL64303.1 hypothetical protein AGRO_2944 [Agrobacterium sp. ATCC 31749]QKW95775.1 hypothetical protein GSF67_00840 [Agrobacterium sp. CGMCC 11546]
MKAPLRSHGFDKPSDLDDHLAELDEEAEAIAAEAKTEKTAAKRTRASHAIDPSLRAELEELRKQLDKIRRDVKRLEAAQYPRHRPAQPHHERDRENSRLMTVVRSVAVTSLASRIFASSPVMAALVAVVPFALGLAVRRSEGS